MDDIPIKYNLELANEILDDNNFPAQMNRKELNKIGKICNIKRKYLGLEFNKSYRKRILKAIKGK